jgi:hypothetical protein
MRRAYTIGAPSVFVNKNGLGLFPEFRGQGVGGSNPLSPTNLLKINNLQVGKIYMNPWHVTRGSIFRSEAPYLLNDIATTISVPRVATAVGFKQKG